MSEAAARLRGVGRLYLPDGESGGAAAAFSAGPEGIAFDDGRAGMVSWPELRARASDYGIGALTLEWERARGPVALVVNDRATLAALSPWLPPVTTATADDPGTQRLSKVLIVLLVGVPLLALLLLVTQAGRIVDWVVDRIPVATEIKLGREAAIQQKTTLQLVEDHPALPVIRELGARITKGSRYPFEFHIARDPAINAFAMPGGFVVLNTGLLEQADVAEEVAGVLAHEVQHVERRHGLRGLVHAAGLSMALRLALGDAGGSIAGAWARDLARLGFSRDQERDADRAGVAALLAAGIDPRGMATFFRKLATGSGSVPALLSSHPASEERFRAVEAMVPSGMHFAPLDAQWAEIRGGG